MTKRTGGQLHDQQQLKALLKETFDSVSGGYDSGALRFFPASAEHMAASLGLRGDEHVLDVACGTGHASLAISKVLKKGRVTAVDFSPGMLDQARKKASALNIGNVEFLERDMQSLNFPAGLFDIAVCAFGIFFVEDMDAQLAHIVSAVRPGGRIMITCFEESYFYPLKEMFFARIEAYGVPPHPQAWRRIANEAGSRELFSKAGLRDIIVRKKNVGYNLRSAEDWWEIVWNAGLRRMVTRLTAEDQERFKREHLREVEALRTKEGIWLDVGVLYTVGTKPVEHL
jgi:ubiquinone/menaquinone biosynthesis C-methylase UbiE